MRQEVVNLKHLGRFPSYTEEISEERVRQYEEAVAKIIPPVTEQEAFALCQLLGPDDFYGIAWSVVHLVETAPNWPLEHAIRLAHAEWQEVLGQRAENANYPSINP